MLLAVEGIRGLQARVVTLEQQLGVRPAETAAAPGATAGTSTHGLGLSVDLGLDGRAQAWMRANADRFGFVEDVAGEPWHWTYRPGA